MSPPYDTFLAQYCPLSIELEIMNACIKKWPIGDDAVDSALRDLGFIYIYGDKSSKM